MQTAVQVTHFPQSYNPKAAYGTIPKAVILKYLPTLSGSAVKLLMGLINLTDPFYRIKYPEKMKNCYLETMTGLSKNSIGPAFRDLEKAGIIGGYRPGKGARNTSCYFTFDIDHYLTKECCLDIEEMEDYFATLQAKRSGSPAPLPPLTDGDPGENIPENGTPLSQKMGHNEGKHPKNCDTNLYDFYNVSNVIVLAQKNRNFMHWFNEFCIDDSAKYRKNTFFWITQKAIEYKSTLEDIIDALRIASEKGKQGKIGYLFGIMKNKSGNRSAGIKTPGKPEDIRMAEIIREAIRDYRDYLDDVQVIIDKKTVEYTPKCDQERPTLTAIFDRLKYDIKRETGFEVTFTAIERG